MEKKLRIHGFTCLCIQVQLSHAREPNTQLAHLLYILWDGMSSPGPTHHSKRCPFLPSVVSKRPILSLHPLPTAPRIYMHKLNICYTYMYIYICRFTPPTSLPRQGHATPGTRTAPGPTAAAGGPRGAGGPRSPTSSSQTARARKPQDRSPAGTDPPPPPLPETPAKGQRQQTKDKLAC